MRFVAFCLMLICLVPFNVQAQTVWDGPTVLFSKEGGQDPTLPENQDRLTGTVWLTRGNSAGIFNAAVEAAFDETVSPVGTLWAYDGLNGNPTGSAFSADQCAQSPSPCVFSNWFDAMGGQGSMGNFLFDRPSVVRLVNDDIYVDLTITAWGSAGGAFVDWERTSSSVAVPLPLWTIALLGLWLWRAGRRLNPT